MKARDIKVGATLAFQPTGSPVIKVKVVSEQPGGEFRVRAITPDGTYPSQFDHEWARKASVPKDLSDADREAVEVKLAETYPDGTLDVQPAQVQPWTEDEDVKEAAALRLAARKAAIHKVAVAAGVDPDDLYALDGGQPETVGTYAAAFRGNTVTDYAGDWDIRLPLTLLEKIAGTA
jgi:hypothetical protein